MAVIAVIGFICFTINTITNNRKKAQAEQEVFRMVTDNLTRARAGASGRYTKGSDSDIYQKVREEDHVS